MNGVTVPGTYCFGTYTATRRVYGAGWLVVTTRVAGSRGSTVPNVPESRATPGYILLSAELIVKVKIVPWGTSSFTVISAAGVCVEPMMKLPLTSGGGTVPSGNSLA